MERRTPFVSDEVEKRGQAVKRFQALCDMHRVPFGEAENLRAFVACLKEDRHLAMDFWAMVGDLSSRERGALSDEEMLGVIVESSSGQTVTSLPQSTRDAVEELKQMLAGVDIAAPVLPDTIDEPNDMLLSPERHRVLQARNSTLQPMDNTDLHTTQRTIAEALLRLEQTSRELREQLAAVERVKNIKSRQVQAADGVRATENSEVPKEAAPELVNDTVQQARIAEVKVAEPAPEIEKVNIVPEAKAAIPLRDEHEVFAPRPVHSLSPRGLSLSDDGDDDPSIVVPLAAYSESTGSTGSRFGLRAALVLIVLALGGAVWFAASHGYAREWISRYGPVAKWKLGLFREEVRDLSSKGSSAPKPEKPSTPAPASASVPASAPAAAAAASEPPAAPVPQPAQKAPVPQPEPPPAPQKDVPVAVARSAPAVHEQAEFSEVNAIKVSPATMEAHLVASRVPAYPELAKARGIAGTVVMETVISASGAVERVHVLHGDPHLRAAAEEAVMRWRYEPYRLNGQPVEVATQVSVVFRLPGR